MVAEQHPDTGFHYVHVFPRNRVFEEIEACYRHAAARIPWMSVGTLSHWSAANPGWMDEGLFLVFWGSFPSLPEDRLARVAHRYTESAGPTQGLIPNQQAQQQRIIDSGQEPDLILAGSPVLLEILRPHCRRITLYPIGYEPEVMGVPDWSAYKVYDYGFHGTPVGRRVEILALLKSCLGRRLLEIQIFGRRRKQSLDVCLADLHVGHSSEPSFPGMRLWQAIATSSAIVTEKRDAWPALEGRHYVAIDHFNPEDPGKFLTAIEASLHQPLLQIARIAHDELSSYRVARCMNEFLIPASAPIERVSR